MLSLCRASHWIHSSCSWVVPGCWHIAVSTVVAIFHVISACGAIVPIFNPFDIIVTITSYSILIQGNMGGFICWRRSHISLSDDISLPTSVSPRLLGLLILLRLLELRWQWLLLYLLVVLCGHCWGWVLHARVVWLVHLLGLLLVALHRINCFLLLYNFLL